MNLPTSATVNACAKVVALTLFISFFATDLVQGQSSVLDNNLPANNVPTNNAPQNPVARRGQFSGSPQEFIRSSSPLGNGTTITTTTTPGQETRTEIGFDSNARNQIETQFQAGTTANSNAQTNQLTNPQQITPQQYQQQLYQQQLYRTQLYHQQQAQLYERQRLAMVNQQSVLDNQQVTPQPNQQIQNLSTQNQPATNPLTFNPVPSNQFTQGQVPANRVPTLGTPTRVVGPQFDWSRGANCQCNRIGLPAANNYPLGGVTANSNLGSNGYQTNLAFQNQSPGTYQGQGLFGQRKAYVDGQPVRNLFRYVTP